MADSVGIEVVCALPERQEVIRLKVPEGTTILEAARLSGLPERFPEVELNPARLGVFGRLCPPERIVAAGDRVEIYRPLRADPKDRRRQRANRGEGVTGAG